MVVDRRLLSPRSERMLVRACIINPGLTAREIQAQVQGPSTSVSIDTVKRTLRRHGIVAYRPIKAPSLNAAQKKTRLLWCRAHQGWTVTDWQKVSNFFDIFLLKFKNYNLKTFFRRSSSRMRRMLMLVKCGDSLFIAEEDKGSLLSTLNPTEHSDNGFYFGDAFLLEVLVL